VAAALAMLPADVPAIAGVVFQRVCTDVLHPERILDCLPLGGTVEISFRDGENLLIVVSTGGPPQIATRDPSGKPLHPTLALEAAPVGATCASARLVPSSETPPPFERVTIRIDPGMDHPVWAIRADGTAIPVRFDGSVTSIASPVPLLLGPQLTVIAHDGSVLGIALGPVSGIDVCLAPDGGLLVLG